jgi:hypothetical protein
MVHGRTCAETERLSWSGVSFGEDSVLSATVRVPFLFENLQQQASQLLLVVASSVLGQPSPQVGLGELKGLLPVS